MGISFSMLDEQQHKQNRIGTKIGLVWKCCVHTKKSEQIAMIDHNMVLGLHWIGLDGLKTESSVKV